MAERGLRLRDALPLMLVRPDQVVIHQGERSSRVYRVEAGLLRATATNADGCALTLDVLGPGDGVGETGDTVSGVTVRAIGSARLREAGTDEMISLFASRARRGEALASDLAWLDVPERVWRRLADLAARFGQPTASGTEIAVPLTQETIAEMAGTSRESANRALRRLMAEGRLASVGRGRYVVGGSLRVVGASGLPR